ncbi:MBL fold metallo-hydrolase [Filifactor villosus]|uniref:MBL fold metallo-hydrolase n=1 Tax=Filifactor villosus TaxID=29374 RepID=A0ABV9QJT3_9FIRM
MKRNVKSNVWWVGFIDWELEQFHGDDYSIYNGSSQNAYLIEEEKTVLIDTVWKPHDRHFIDNLKQEIDLNKIDYIIVNHGEIDHSGSLPALMKEIPDTPIYCTKNALSSLKGQFHEDWNFNVVKTGDTLDIGNGKQLIFVEMKMLHWPDSMATYMTGDNILFSNDAFGQHFAVQELFNDKADTCLLDKEAMKYYANILTPFSPLVKKKLEEISGFNLPIDIIAPSHGVIWRDNPIQIVEKYAKWCDNYQEDQITIVYDTMWEACTSIAHLLGEYLHELSPDTKIKIFNCSKEDKNEIMTEVFKSKAIIVGSPTVGQDVLSSVAGWLHFLKSLKFKNKKAAAFGTYGWSGEAPKLIREALIQAGFDTIETFAKVNWTLKEEDKEQLRQLAKDLIDAC